MTNLHPLRCETCDYSNIEETEYEDGIYVEVFCSKLNNESVSFSFGCDPPAKSILGCGSHSQLEKYKNEWW